MWCQQTGVDIPNLASRCRQTSLKRSHETPTGFFFFFSTLPCDSSPSANIIPGPTAPAHDDPILVLQADSGWRVRERERLERFEAVDCKLTVRSRSCTSKPGADFQQDMVSRSADDVAAPPRQLVTFSSLCAACLSGCELTFH